MIIGLNQMLRHKDNSQLHDLRELIQQCSGGTAASGRFLGEESLSIQDSEVYRISWESGDDVHSLVVKRFTTRCSSVERRVLTRWLPGAGLEHFAPRLLGVAPEPSGEHVWHVYEDLGNSALDHITAAHESGFDKDRGFLSPMGERLDHDCIEILIRMISTLHERFQNHIMLDECRQHSADLGANFLRTSVQDALATLESLLDLKVGGIRAHSNALADLFDKLTRLHDEMAWRCDLLTSAGGSPTLLHGDFSVKNAFVLQTDTGFAGRLIDWDHAGTGPSSYDLSTFLMQLPVTDRIWTLDAYTRMRNPKSTDWPSYETWNLLFETNEYARLANSVIWPSRALHDRQADWAFEELASIASWFDGMKPVLPMVQEEKVGKAIQSIPRRERSNL